MKKLSTGWILLNQAMFITSSLYQLIFNKINCKIVLHQKYFLSQKLPLPITYRILIKEMKKICEIQFLQIIVLNENFCCPSKISSNCQSRECNKLNIRNIQMYVYEYPEWKFLLTPMGVLALGVFKCLTRLLNHHP